MNDKLILERIVTKGIYRLMCLLIGILLLLSCGSDNAKEEPNGDTGNTISKCLLLLPNGLYTVEISSINNDFVFPFQISLMGSCTNPDGDGKARIGVWSEGELRTYNNKEETSYTLLPSLLYFPTSIDLNFLPLRSYTFQFRLDSRV